MIESLFNRSQTFFDLPPQQKDFKKIDKLVYQLYDLTEDEIKIVEVE